MAGWREIFSFVVFLGVGGCDQYASYLDPMRAENRLYEFLKNSELRATTLQEKNFLKKFFEDVLCLSPDQLRQKRYPDNKGVLDQWEAPHVLNYYIFSDSPTVPAIEMETFYDEISDAQVRLRFTYYLREMEGFTPS